MHHVLLQCPYTNLHAFITCISIMKVIEFNSLWQVPYLGGSFGIIYILEKPAVSI